MKSLLFKIVLFWASVGLADKPAVHGIVVFGDKITYASHLPMFHSPHDYQLIMQIKLANGPRSPQTLGLYQAEKEKGQVLFTLETPIMDLTEIIDGKKGPFMATLYSGHFEKNGAILGLVWVSVEKIIFSKKLDSQDPDKYNDYLVFGASGEYFAAHLIKSFPSFDFISKVSQPVTVGICIPYRNICDGSDSYLVEDAKLPIVLQSAPFLSQPPTAGSTLGYLHQTRLGPKGTTAEVDQVIYSETEELAH
jgi:hypothetical protein